jgi:hypothetical protein
MERGGDMMDVQSGGVSPMVVLQQLLTFPTMLVIWIWISSIVLSYIVAIEKQRSGSNWAAAAVFTGLLALIAVVGLPPAEPRYSFREEPELPPKLATPAREAGQGRQVRQGHRGQARRAS